MKKAAKKIVAKKVAPKAAQKGAPAKAPRVPKPAALPEIYYRGHALLNLVRCIAQHEDRLCILVHAMKQRGTVGAAMTKDLRALLQQMPAEDYAAELRALEDELA